ncbi:hypothetical protein Tco_1345359 [Tanacetum coccineum]
MTSNLFSVIMVVISVVFDVWSRLNVWLPCHTKGYLHLINILRKADLFSDTSHPRFKGYSGVGSKSNNLRSLLEMGTFPPVAESLAITELVSGFKSKAILGIMASRHRNLELVKRSNNRSNIGAQDLGYYETEFGETGGFDRGFASFLNTASFAVTYLSNICFDTPFVSEDAEGLE